MIYFSQRSEKIGSSHFDLELLIRTMPTKKPKSPKKPATRKAPAKKKAAAVAPLNVCANCAPLPLGHTQVLAMMIVSVFAVSGVLLTAVATVNQQHDQIEQQAEVIETLTEQEAE